jgi:5'-phosphate synthase pdxT subunit
LVTVGVLALQGGVIEHLRLLNSMGIESRAVKSVEELAEVDGLIIPGGESTTISKLLDIFNLRESLSKLIAAGLPTLGTCAGLILLSKEVDGQDGVFRALSCSVERNAYGSQLASGEALVLYDTGEEERGAFIRAPRIVNSGKARPIGWVGEEIVAVLEGNVIGASYHPELTNSTMLHQKLIQLIKAR